ncbi:MAG: gamma-glutamyltransferase family protein [Thermomicrobiales bacterium]|nr:gamma-glutamyltransferase family protein [Thermomicrobiales bacterium]
MSNESTWIVERSEAVSSGGMVAAKTLQAARAGAEILRNGGNAIDAAVATALVAGVVEQWMNGVGGGGYLVRHDPRTGETDVAAFPMVSPKSARPDMFTLIGTGRDTGLFGWPSVVDSANIVGHRSVAVPGTVDGLSKALERWGSISWSAALDPAIHWADEGFPITWHTTTKIAADLANLRKFPATAELLCPNGVPPWSIQGEPLKRLRQPDLARTLRRLADRGPRDLYEGELAATIIAHLNEGGADFVAADFSDYRTTFEPPASASYHGATLHTIGLGTGGTTLAESMELLDRSGFDGSGPDSASGIHLLAQAFATAFADRFAYLADPDFVEVPMEALLSDAYLDARASAFTSGAVGLPTAGTRSALGVSHALATSIPDFTSGGSTTHLSVIDKDGVAVSLTQTLLSGWGSRVTVPGTGIIMNNGMMWFDPEPGRPNSIDGGKRPLCNMSPAVLTTPDGLIAALGASGGRRILNCVAQMAINLVDRKLGMQAAVAAPRIDRSTPHLIVSNRLDGAIVDELEALGHAVAVKDETLLLGEFSSPACVRFDGNTFTGGVDPWYYPATATGV